MRRHALLIGAWTTALTVVLAGCGSGVEPGKPVREISVLTLADLESQAREQGWTEQAEVLARGVVTRADYEQAIDDVRVCAEEGGNGISEPTLSSVDNLTLEFGFPVGAMDDDEIWDLSDRCMQRWFWSIESGYLATHDPVMDADILAAALTCMEDAGFPMAGEIRNARDIAVRVPLESGEVVSDCIVESAVSVRPDLPSVGVSW